MQNALINVNGQLSAAKDAKVQVFDRGYLYGDSLYEVMRSYEGRLFQMDAHLLRLEQSARLCHMTLRRPRGFWIEEIERTVRAYRQTAGQDHEIYARLIVSRGIGRIGFGSNCVESAESYSILIQPLAPPTDEQVSRGFALKVVDRLRNDPRALDPAMKSGNYLNSVLAFLEATEQSGIKGSLPGSRPEAFDDALLCNAHGHLTEGTTFNIFYVKRGIVATPPLDIGILDGITRRDVIRLARENGLEVREVRFPKERLYEADEVFLTSTIKEVFPVTQVDHCRIRGGKPGPVTLRLRGLFRKFAQS